MSNTDEMIALLTYHSNAIEGNALSFDEVREIVINDAEPRYASFKDVAETRSHADSMRETFFATAKDTVLLETDLKMFHRVFFMPFEKREAGMWRTQPVYMRTSKGWKTFPEWKDVPLLVSEVFSDLGELKSRENPLERAALLHFRIVSIHPFVDGNGRATRLISASAAMQGGFPPVFIPVEKRPRYIRSLEAGEQEFVRFFMEVAEEQIVK